MSICVLHLLGNLKHSTEWRDTPGIVSWVARGWEYTWGDGGVGGGGGGGGASVGSKYIIFFDFSLIINAFIKHTFVEA